MEMLTGTTVQTRKNPIERLLNHHRDLRNIINSSQRNDQAVEESYCLEHFFEAGGGSIYSQIATFCKQRNISRVVDIGCCYGHQSEMFRNENIGYHGVDRTDYHKFWNDDVFTYQKGSYPCSIPVNKGDLGISVLCLTWNCYLNDRENTLREQTEALKTDFEHCLLYISEEAKEYLSRYFNHVEKLAENLYYFRNDQEEAGL